MHNSLIFVATFFKNNNPDDKFFMIFMIFIHIKMSCIQMKSPKTLCIQTKSPKTL